MVELERNKDSLSTSGDVPRLLQYVRAVNLFLVRQLTPQEAAALFVLAQVLVQAQQPLVQRCGQDRATALTVARFLGTALQLAASPADSNSVLRLAEILLTHGQIAASLQRLICASLVDRAFFQSCLRILQARSIGLSFSPSPKAPSEFHASLLALLLKPLVLLLPVDAKVVVRFSREVLTQSQHAVVADFVLPALADVKGDSFPVGLFMDRAAEAVGKEQLPAADIWQCWSWCRLVGAWAGSLQGSTAILTVLNHALMGLIKAQALIVADDDKRRKVLEEESEDEEMDEGPTSKGHSVEKGPSKEDEREGQARRDILAAIESPAFISLVLSALEVCPTIRTRLVGVISPTTSVALGQVGDGGGGCGGHVYVADKQPRQGCRQYADALLQDGL